MTGLMDVLESLAGVRAGELALRASAVGVQFLHSDSGSNTVLHILCPRLNQRMNLEIQLSAGSQLLISVKCLLLGPLKNHSLGPER